MPHFMRDTLRSSVPGATMSGFFRRILIGDHEAPDGVAVEVVGDMVGADGAPVRTFFHTESGGTRRYDLHPEQGWKRAFHHSAPAEVRDESPRYGGPSFGPLADVPPAVRLLADGGGFATPPELRGGSPIVDRTGAQVGWLTLDDVVHRDLLPGEQSRRYDLSRLAWPDGANEAIYVPHYCDTSAYLLALTEAQP